mgnify:FL=1
MAITLNGNGTITGISVGGLPDGIVDTDMTAARAKSISFFGQTAGTQSIASGVWVPITGLSSNTISQNTGTSWDTTNGRFTVASGQEGTYIFYANITLNNMHRWQYLYLGFSINGVDPTHFAKDQSPYAGSSTSDVLGTARISTIKTLSVGDYVELELQHSHGSDLTTSTGYTAFGGMRLALL